MSRKVIIFSLPHRFSGGRVGPFLLTAFRRIHVQSNRARLCCSASVYISRIPPSCIVSGNNAASSLPPLLSLPQPAPLPLHFYISGSCHRHRLLISTSAGRIIIFLIFGPVVSVNCRDVSIAGVSLDFTWRWFCPFWRCPPPQPSTPPTCPPPHPSVQPTDCFCIDATPHSLSQTSGCAHRIP